jgi:hypothetical protein
MRNVADPYLRCCQAPAEHHEQQQKNHERRDQSQLGRG